MIGVGTDWGDDRAGLRVAELLERRLPADVGVVACRNPGLELADALRGVDAAVVVDAVRSGSPAGHVRRVEPEALAEPRAFSTHGLGVVEGLALARALGCAPARLAIVGIEADHLGGETLSPAVERGARAACEHVLELLADLRAMQPDTGGAARA